MAAIHGGVSEHLTDLEVGGAFSLWPFQLEAARECQHKYRQGVKRLILCSPTGSGKTIMACHLVKQSLAKGKRVTVLVDRLELLKQFYAALRKFGLSPSIVDAGSKPMKSNLYLGMITSYYTRAKKTPHLTNVDFLVCDEAHSTAYWKLFKIMPEAYVLGLTATPVTGTKARLNQAYQDLVELAKVETLIKQKYLVNSITYSVDLADSKKLKRKNGEFTEESQMEMLANDQVYAGALEQYLKLCPGEKFICYNINVKHSRSICQYFNENGVSCAHVDGNTPPEERAQIFEDFKLGRIKGIHNFGICTTGYDEPSVTCVIQNFATNSLSKSIQTAGRGARLYKRKDKFYILDMGQNYARHGLWNTNKNWNNIFHHPQAVAERQEQEAIKHLSCSTCGYVMQDSKLSNCPVCNTDVKVSLEKVRSNAKAQGATKADLKLIRKKAISMLPGHLQNRSYSSMSHEELLEYANHMGYSAKWVFIQLKLRRQGK